MKSPHILTMFLATSALALTSVNAQTTTTVTSDVVGYVSKSIPSGVSLTAFPMIKSPVYSGPLASDAVNGNIITVAATLDSNSSYYLHVTSGSASGGYETITTSNATTVTLEGEITGLAGGDSVRIVEHNTLGDLTAASGNSIPDNSTVTIYNSNGSSATYTILSNIWYDSGFAVGDDVIVFPGEGVAIGMSGDAVLTYTGTVNTENYDVEITSGVVNIVSSMNPSSPTGSTSLGSALGTLADNSVVTSYSEDGTLTGESYTLLSGVYYDSGFATASIAPAAPTAVVVSPSTTGVVSLSPAL